MQEEPSQRGWDEVAVPGKRWHVEGREASSSLADPGNDSSRGRFSFLKSNVDLLT